MKTNAKNILFTFLFFISSLFLVILYTLVDNFVFLNQLSKIANTNIQNQIITKEEYLQNYIKKATDTINALAKNEIFFNYLKEDKSNDTNLKDLFEASILSDKDIMQIRFIDKNGIEKIRFDRKNEKIEKIETLQDKSNRDYFFKSKNKQEKVWFSKIDLNVELGELEKPFNPTYRAILPIKKDKTFQGILIINYFAKDKLETLVNSELFDITLIDNSGYIIQDKNPNLNWSRFQNKKFKVDNEIIQNLKQDSFNIKDTYYKKLNLPYEDTLFLGVSVSKKYTNEKKELYNSRALIVIGIFTILNINLSFIVYYFLTKLQNNQIQIKILSKEKIEKNKLLIQNSKMASLGEMLANIAHQWRQPLSILSLHILSLQKRYERDMIDEKFMKHFFEKNK